jgi:simple sugar transport system ATP-binding protein
VPELQLRAGEIVTVAAIEGNGQHEFLRAIAGLLPLASGSLEVAQPIAFVPEDRTTEALLLDRSLADNMVLGVGSPAPWRHRWTIDWPLARTRTAELISRFNIRAGGPSVTAETLSGGNQQKLVLARALERHPQVLVLENPTRGLDFDATAFIHAQLRAAASAGAAVLVHSTDLDEVLALGDRVVVVTDGRVVPAAPNADRASVGDLMLGTTQ